MSSFEVRKSLFSELCEYRDRDVITLVTSDKKPEELFSTQIAQDILPIFYGLLSVMDRKEKLDLIIHSTGGQIDVPWPLINLLREYYLDINVVVPWRAQSAATLICLGANKIGMSPLGTLSPIDPQFQIKLQDKQIVGAGVEDIYGYYRLITETLSLDSMGRSEALKLLASRVTPEILGKISRVRREIRIIATNLLKLHMTNETKIEKIVGALVEELPSHQYMINRKEATVLQLTVFDLDERLEKLSFDIINSYVKESRMDEPGMLVDLGNEATKTMELNRAFIETRDKSFVFRSEYTFHRDGKVERKQDRWQEGQ